MNRRGFATALGALALMRGAPALAQAPRADLVRVQALKITVLDTNLAGDPSAGQGEWGFAALVEVDGRRFLYDTGASPDMVLRNARALNLDLADIEDVILSHNHRDHTAGLLMLRRELLQINPRALSRAHVGAGMFEPRYTASGADGNFAASIRTDYLASGGAFIIHDGPSELAPGVWLIAPVPRPHDERNWPAGMFEVETPTGRAEDTVAEDASLVCVAAEGLIVLTGCGHAGVVNICEEARRISGGARIDAVIGGLHLLEASDEKLVWTSRMLRRFGVRHLLAAHCTGFEATYRLREELHLTRESAVVAAVGSSFTLGAGIDPLMLAR